MIVKPNQTRIVGRITAIRPEPDGWGAQLDMEVIRNETVSPDDDFLKPAAGARMTAFFAQPEGLNIGDVVNADASLAGGPTGQRAVLRSVRPVRDGS